MKFKRVKTHIFNKRRYRIRWRKPKDENDIGECSNPECKNPLMNIDPNLSEEQLLDTTIHEGLHACLWVLDEETVAQTATDLAKFLYRMGWRIEKATLPD